MSFELSGSIVTQSGTDTSFGALSAIAGVQMIATNTGTIYYMPTLQLTINGTITIDDPMVSSVICTRIQIGTTGNYRSGKFAADGVTPLYAGTHFQCIVAGSSESHFMPMDLLSGALTIAGGGQLTIIGGDYRLSGGIHYASGAVIREYNTSVIASNPRTSTTSARIRAFSANVIKRNVKHYDIGYDLFVMPTEYSVQAFGSEYVAQYVGSLAGGIDAKFTASALSNVGGVKDFDNWGGGWIELYNCAKGANLAVTANTVSTHCIPLFQTVNLKVTDLVGVAKQNIKYKCVDAPVSNTPTVTITTIGALKTWDFRTPVTYSGVTNVSGLATVNPVLQIWYGNTNIKNLRFPSSTATFKFRSYDSQSQESSIVLGSDTAQSISMAIPNIPFIGLSEAIAGALTGISLVSSGVSGGAVTISSAHTVSELFCYYRWWISQYDNFNSNDTWTYDGTILNLGSWTVSGVEFLSGGIITSSSITSNGAVSDISFIGNVIQNTATSLTNVGVSGILIYNDATSKSITFSGCNIGEVRNDGVGIITISGGAVTTYTDAQINMLNSSATILLPTGYNRFTLHSSSTDADAGINAVFNGTDTDNTIQYKAESFGGSTLWIRATIDGDTTTEIYRGQVVPIGVGNYTFSAIAFSETVQYASLSARMDALTTAVQSSAATASTADIATAVWANTTRTITNVPTIDNMAIASAVWSNTTRDLTVASGMTPTQEAKLDATLKTANYVAPLNNTKEQIADAVWSKELR